MKKHLLLGSALLAAISAYPQNGRQPGNYNVSVENTAAKIAKRFAYQNAPVENAASAASTPASSTQESSTGNLKPSNTSSFSPTSWNPFTGSMNIYGSIVSGSAPLHFNEDLNAVSFVHRKSTTYQPVPTPASSDAASGAMVAMISQNFGGNWDSTCFYTNDTHWGRYPHGAIYNPAGNTCMDQAYIVGTGPVTINGGGWVGNFYASKQLGAANYNATSSTTLNAVQVMLHSNTGVNKIDFARYDFSTTDDGKVRTLGQIAKDISGTTAAAIGYRGARLMTGSYNAGVFTWVPDSIIPQTVETAGAKEIITVPYMAWNEAGTVGYVVHIGVASTATNNNRGFQPIIWKTINSGTSWAPVNGINFNAPGMEPVLDHILSTRVSTAVTIPFFDTNEGIGLTVDKNDNLHIVSLVKGSTSQHPDSLGFTYLFNNADGERYNYLHVPGVRPYLYDFIGNGGPASTWSVVTVDSLSSEAPSGDPAFPDGFSTSPWLVGTAGIKPTSDARVQASRTADGNYIVYTFAESDTALTPNGFKWNSLPNVKARLLNVTTQSVSPVEINITRPPVQAQINSNVSSRAYFHYASRKCVVAQTTPVGANGPCIALPIVVTRNSNLDPMTAVVHRYATANLNFGTVPAADTDLPLKAACATETTSILENHVASVNNSFIYPNPAKNSATLSLYLIDNTTVSVTVANMIGQVVSTSSTEGSAGENNVNVNVNGLPKGIYMVTVKVENATSTKKLIVE